MMLSSVVLLLARIKVKVHGAGGGGDVSWGGLLALAGLVALIWTVVYLLNRYGKDKRQESVRKSVELARQKGCVDAADKCWFCGSPVSGRAIAVPVNNRGPLNNEQWKVQKVPVFCCEECQSNPDAPLLLGHPRIAPLLLQDFKLGTGE